jgi:hypothetical protein
VLEGDEMREDLEGELLFDDDENTVKISILFGISSSICTTRYCRWYLAKFTKKYRLLLNDSQCRDEPQIKEFSCHL